MAGEIRRKDSRHQAAPRVEVDRVGRRPSMDPIPEAPPEATLPKGSRYRVVLEGRGSLLSRAPTRLRAPLRQVPDLLHSVRTRVVPVCPGALVDLEVRVDPAGRGFDPPASP